MHLIGLCAALWLSLLGGVVTLWLALPQPRSVSDIVALTVATVACLGFSRLGLASLLALVLSVLPAGRLRTRLGAGVLRWAPTVLRSGVIAAVALGGASHAAHASPVPGAQDDGRAEVAAVQVAAGGHGAAGEGNDPTTRGLPDPGWPTVTEGPPGSSEPTAPEPGEPAATEPPLDPGWPTAAPEPDDDLDSGETDESPESPSDTDDSRAPGETSSPADVPRITSHIVVPGESLWSIAEDFADTPAEQAELVRTLYADNREVIGADPNLIMPGQRLEIRP